MKPHPSRLQLENYTYQTDIPTRFADVDPLWHLNNVRIVELYQEGRIAFNQALAGECDWPRGSSHRLVVARQSVDYLDELKWPGRILLGAGVARVGNSSFTLVMALFQNDRCAGISDTVMVHASDKGAAPLPARMRELLQQNLFKDPQGINRGVA